MKICILNGSPKSIQDSLTMYYAAYLAETFSEHTFIPLPISQHINHLQHATEAYRRVIDEIGSADIVLWALPIYKFWIPAQLLRFIELVIERGDTLVFADKYTTVLSTSIRCFDHTAHAYLQQISAEWGMHFSRGFSAEMDDIKYPHQREHLKRFFERFLRQAKNRVISDEIAPLPIMPSNFRYQPPVIEPQAKTSRKQVTWLTDASAQDENLLHMAAVVQKQLPYPVATELNLHKLMAQNAWCLGCVKCMLLSQCSRKDDFAEAVLRPLEAADIIVVATAIRGRSVSSTLKMFLDRTIVYGHAPGLIARKPVIILLVSGPLRQLPEVRQMLEYCFKRFGAADVICVTDEDNDSDRLTQRLLACVAEVIWTADSKLYMPELFLGKAARVLVRDFVYTNRAVLPLDHKMYTQLGLYEHLPPDLGNEIFNRMGVFLTRFAGIRNWLAKNAKKVLIGRLQKAYPLALKWDAARIPAPDEPAPTPSQSETALT